MGTSNRFIIIMLMAVILAGMQSAEAVGGDVMVLQSAGLPSYHAAVNGFETVLLQDIPVAGPKSVRAHSLSIYNLSTVESPNLLRREIHEKRPDLMLAVGSSSLALIKDISDIPIIYLLVPYPQLVADERENITGINMQISAAKQLENMKKVLPQVSRVGLLYDPERTGEFVRAALEYAGQNKIILTALPVKDCSEVPAGLAGLAGKVDLFWMLPDRTVLTPQTIDYLFLFSLENRMPVFTFSQKYLDMGAILSVSFDPFDMGKQAGELALDILQNAAGNLPAPQQIRSVIINRNSAAAKILGIEYTAETVSGK